MSLASLQATFFEWVAGAEAVPEQPAADAVHGGALDPAARVGVYAEMYWLRMRDVLRSDFPLTVAALGDEAFEVQVAKYLKVHPSTHHSLGQLGQHFAEFLKPEGWVADLAALEWARGQSFVALDSPVIDASALSAIDAQTFASVRLRATPSVRVLTLSHDVLPRFQGSDATPEARATSVVVWRRDFQVFHVELSAPEAQALSAVLQGHELPVVCEPFSEPSEAFTAIASWANEGMLAEV